VFVEQRRHRFHPVQPFAFTGDEEGSGDRVLAPMPGRIVALSVEAGQTVQAEQPLLVMEAMKMELTLRAPRDGVLAAINAAVGEFVEADCILVQLEAES